MFQRSTGQHGMLAGALFVLCFALMPAPAFSQTQNSRQAGCITSVNGAIAKVATTEQRQISSCVSDAVDGLLSGLPGAVNLCLLDPAGDAAAAILKAEAVEAKRCEQTPDFGYVPVQTAAAVAVSQEIALAGDIFGDDMDDALVSAASDPAGAACQASVARFYTRMNAARLRAFVDCKKKGLLSGQIDSVSKLDECFDVIEADEQGKIAKANAKLAKAYIKRCLDHPDPDALFPGECAGQPDFLACVDENARCRMCLMLNQVDGLSHDCERFDNNLLDGSCVDPSADECAGENGGNNCSPNASCTDVENGFTCECDEGYEGDGVTCKDANECKDNTDDCDAHATCTNTVGSFTCACNSGWSGDGRTCSDVNECALNTDNCDANATCTNTPGSFLCTCNPGWIGTGQACIDRNECALNVDNCSSLATCANIPGSFTCTCIPGYGGDGTVCIDFNECLGQGGGNNCSVFGQCINRPGSFDCNCLSGFSGDGVTCVDNNECLLNTDNCHANATCTNTIGSFTCACLPGFGGNGVTCTDFNECLGQGGGNNCSVNANCTNLPGSFGCACKPGYYGNPVGGTCQPIQVNITSPAHGIFTTATSILVTGTVTADPISDVALTVKTGAGAPVTVPIAANGTWSVTVPLNATLIYNGIRAEARQISTNFKVRDRRVVINGQSKPFSPTNTTTPVPQAVGLRITDPGFNEIEGLLTSLVDIDLAALLPVGTVLISDQCFLDSIFGCIIRASVRVASPAPSLASYSLDVNSMTNFVHGTIVLNGLVVHLQIYGGVDCGLRVSASTVTINGDFLLEPYPNAYPSPLASEIDVNQNGNVTVGFSAFGHDFTSGICSVPIIEDIVDLAIGDVQGQVRDALVDFLKDPDSSGPDDSPIAAAIETALSQITLAGPIGVGLGVDLHTPLFSVPEDNSGITLASNAFMSTLTPAPGAPHFANTLYIPQTFPFAQLQSTTSPHGAQYDMALVLSDSAFNQVLAGQVESGLLSAELTEIELVPGTGTTPITAGLLSAIVPEFGQLDPDLALKLKIEPTLAPALPGTTGPNGELAELIVSHLLVKVQTLNGATTYASIAADLMAGFDIDIEAGTGNLLPVLTAPDANDIAITLLTNPLGVDEATLQAVIPDLLAPLIPSLSGLLGAIPLPSFLGLEVSAVDVTRTGQFIGVFLNAE